MFEKALITHSAPAKPAVSPVIQPARVAPVEAPKMFAPAIKPIKKQEPVDDDEELENMMMQELMNRSQ